MNDLAPTRSASVIFLVATAFGAVASADPPPKVCVVVAGDPDENIRGIALNLADFIGIHPALRGVADPDARAALRGERPTPEGMAEFATARRELHGVDRDSAALDPLAHSLGCALVVELASHPSTTMLRVYDVVHQTWQEAHEVPAIDNSAVDQWVVPVAHPPATEPVIPALPSSADAGVQPAVAPAAPAATTAPTPPRPGFWARYWPWFAAGGAVIAVLTIFALTQGQTLASGPVQISVVHPAMP